MDVRARKSHKNGNLNPPESVLLQIDGEIERSFSLLHSHERFTFVLSLLRVL